MPEPLFYFGFYALTVIFLLLVAAIIRIEYRKDFLRIQASFRYAPLCEFVGARIHCTLGRITGRVLAA